MRLEFSEGFSKESRQTTGELRKSWKEYHKIGNTIIYDIGGGDYLLEVNDDDGNTLKLKPFQLTRDIDKDEFNLIEEFKFMHLWVGVTVLKDDGSVLAQLRDDNHDIPSPNVWAFCGGRVESTDISPKHAAVRELSEEVGYKLKPGDLLLVARDNFRVEETRVYREFYWTYHDSTQAIESLEGQEIRFIKPGELNKLQFCDGQHKRLLEKVSGFVRGGRPEHRIGNFG